MTRKGFEASDLLKGETAPASEALPPVEINEHTIEVASNFVRDELKYFYLGELSKDPVPEPVFMRPEVLYDHYHHPGTGGPHAKLGRFTLNPELSKMDFWRVEPVERSMLGILADAWERSLKPHGELIPAGVEYLAWLMEDPATRISEDWKDGKKRIFPGSVVEGVAPRFILTLTHSDTDFEDTEWTVELYDVTSGASFDEGCLMIYLRLP